MTLYGYWRSSAAYRVRIALQLKQVEFQQKFVHLVNNGGEQHSKSYEALNPAHLVPTLVDGDFTLNQSLAIIDYLDELYPQVNLYPSQLKDKATVKALVLDIACEIHPLNNLRVQQYISSELQANDEQRSAWMNYWMGIGFKALETKLAQTSGKYCFKDVITVADLCLVPQVYNAKRFNIDMSAYPNINRIVANCNKLPAFIKALPENQPDAV
ncbi:maleylacetoacetate isomerase [Thalassomonas sp. M1454]|uniref:maleylacetoacetate isomerase n=1 Tax=Thalassomonas sp. M1454 TaxID=2594477 RepID=UPI001181000F|nr:maleylacetoacetate isomerase [Thalassomonas sp. M1454]TRX57529.1 maleylacetoacetate isomerase [Thalassomonas sp. M1454]